MTENAKSQYLWLGVSVVLGVLLGVGLLVESVATYRYVSGNMIRQEAQREADRKTIGFEKALRPVNVRDAAHVAPVMDDLREDASRQIAWARILNADGTLLAATGEAIGTPFSSDRIKQTVEKRAPLTEVRETANGKVLVVMQPIRLGRPGGPGPRTMGPPMIEVAVYLDSVSPSFGLLRQHLIVGCSAALALLGAMVVIGLRFKHYMRGKHLEQQLEMARQVQGDLLPSGSPAYSGLDFAANCLQASEVGGDYYDVFEVEKGKTAVVLGDVSGKGLSAALLMGVIHGSIRSSCWAESTSCHEEASSRLNRLLCAKTASERFASLFSCYYDPRTAILRYVNAGHLPPLLVRENAYGTLEIHRLSDGGPVLGLLPSARYRQGEVTVRPGDLLVLYSDGILEAQGASEEEFGEDRVLRVIRDNWGKSPNEIREAILSDVHEFLAGSTPHDDQTLLVVRLEPVSQVQPQTRYETVSV